MKVTFDTETETMEDLKKLIEIINKAIKEREQGDNQDKIIEKTEEKKEILKDLNKPTSKAAQEALQQERLMKNLDMSKLYQSDKGLQERRAKLYKKG